MFPPQVRMDIAGHPWHRTAFQAPVVGLCTTIHCCLLAAIQLGLSPFSDVIPSENWTLPGVTWDDQI